MRSMTEGLLQSKNNPSGGYRQDVFRFRSRNRRCSADEEKRRETLRVSGSSPLTQGSRITHQPGRGRRLDDPFVLCAGGSKPPPYGLCVF